MSLCQVNFYSRALGMQTNLEVVLPNAAGPFATLYLLHGLGGDHASWRANIALERLADKLPLALVMPDGGKTYYANDPRPGGLAWEDHITRDVVRYVERTFPVVADRRARALAGVSMGGYGAMMLALRHADLFAAISSLSGSLYFQAMPHPRGDRYPTSVMEALPKEGYDCFALAQALRDGAGPELAIRFNCGRGDFLIDCNRKFHEHLDALGLPHEYREDEGGHDWGYWAEHFGETLAFVMEHVKR